MSIVRVQAYERLMLSAELAAPTYEPLGKRTYNPEIHERIGCAPPSIAQLLGQKNKLRQENEGETCRRAREERLLKQAILHNLAQLELSEYLESFENPEQLHLCSNGAIVCLKTQMSVAA